MTFYEELGVPPDAESDTIREAYRNVARLLHPDSQTNPALKESAEVQMKRINQLYEVLSDPDRRRRYDHELAAEPPERPTAIIIHSTPVKTPHRARNGTLVWLAATGLCAGFVIWLATGDSSAPVEYPQAPSLASRAAAAILPNPVADRRRDNEIAQLRAQLAAANADRERLARELAALQPAPRFQPPPAPDRKPAQLPANLPPVPVVASVRPLEIALPPVTTSAPLPPPPPPVPAPVKPAPPQTAPPRWSGLWAYNQSAAANKDRSLIPPEFIEASISEDNGRIRGQYRARFRVAGKGISPDVNFRFEGPISGTAGRLSWTGSGGAHGDVQLRMLPDGALEVSWSANSLGKSMGLASGTAVLHRRK